MLLTLLLRPGGEGSGGDMAARPFLASTMAACSSIGAMEEEATTTCTCSGKKEEAGKAFNFNKYWMHRNRRKLRVVEVLNEVGGW